MTLPHAVLLDTDVFSAIFITPERVARRQGHPLDEWKSAVEGRRIVISFQTRAEELAGARHAQWGEKRLANLMAMLDSTPTVPVDEDVIQAFATLTAEARRVGHGMWAKEHTSDRWIAACAIAKGLPILSGDGIFRDAPSVECL